MSRGKSQGFSLLNRFLTLAVVVSAAGCTGKKTEPTNELNIAIWNNYLSPAMQERFTKETGITLNLTNYSSNEELLAKVQAGGTGIDIAVPSDYMVDIMIKLDLLQPLDKATLKSLAGLDPAFLNQSYDSENRYSLPYGWTISGIAVNRDLYKEPITSWKDLIDNPKLNGKFAMLDDVREVTGAVLKMQGESLNSTDKTVLEKTKSELMRIRGNVKMFTSDTINVLKNNEVIAAHAYSPDALQVRAATGGRIEFIIPKEGASRAIDNLVVLKGAKNPAAAHKLIDFLLRPENNVEFVKAIRAGPVVTGTRAQLPEDLKNDSTLFPSADTRARFEAIKDLGEGNRAYEDIWTSVKTGL